MRWTTIQSCCNSNPRALNAAGVTEGASNSLGGHRQVFINNMVLMSLLVVHVVLCWEWIPKYGVLAAVAAETVNIFFRFVYGVL